MRYLFSLDIGYWYAWNAISLLNRCGPALFTTTDTQLPGSASGHFNFPYRFVPWLGTHSQSLWTLGLFIICLLPSSSCSASLREAETNIISQQQAPTPSSHPTSDVKLSYPILDSYPYPIDSNQTLVSSYPILLLKHCILVQQGSHNSNLNLGLSRCPLKT